MSTILTLYLFQKNWQCFLIILTIVSFVIGLFESIELLRRSMGHFQITGSTIIEAVFLKIPSHIEKLLPFICFFTSTFCLWRLNQKNEIIAMRAIGFSIWQIVSSLCIFYLILGMVDLFIVNPISSALTQRYQSLDERIFKNRSIKNKLSISDTGLWFRETEQDKSYIMHVHSFDLQKNIFRHVTFYQFSKNGIYNERIFAQKATLQDQKWHLENVRIWDNNHHARQIPMMDQPTLLSIEKVHHSQIDPQSMSFWNLQNFIQLLKRSGLSYRAYEMHWHACIAKIALVLSMVLLSCNFCLRPMRYQKITHLIIVGLFLAFIINFSDDIVYALGLANKIPILLAVWIPPLATAMLSISFLIHQEDHV